ncbi:MAG TPA: SagB/ThcOx family dehydrogenase [Kineosporiaceae bacterium]
MRTHALRYENLSGSAFPRPAEEFLIASRNRRWDRETRLSVAAGASDGELTARARTDRETAGEARIVALPQPTVLTMALTDVVSARRSVRTFTGDPLALADLATIVRHSASITAQGEVDLESGARVRMGFRASPSGGALFPIQTWVAALRVAGLPRTVYRYRPHEDALSPLPDPGEDLADRLCTALDVQDGAIDVGSVGAMLLWVARPWRSMRKYGARGMRLVLQECGAHALSAALAATAAGLGFVDFSGFYDDEANQILGLDGLHATLLHLAMIGASR